MLEVTCDPSGKANEREGKTKEREEEMRGKEEIERT